MGLPVKEGASVTARERVDSGTEEGVDKKVLGDAAGRGSFDGSMILYELVFSFAWGTGTIPYFTAVR